MSAGICVSVWQSFFTASFIGGPLVELERHSRRLRWRNCMGSLKTGRRIKLNLRNRISSSTTLWVSLSILMFFNSLGWFLPFSHPSVSAVSSSSSPLSSSFSSASLFVFASRVSEGLEEHPLLITVQRGDFFGSDSGETKHDLTCTASTKDALAEICSRSD